MSKQTEALKLALDWIEGNGKYDAAKRIAQTIREALAEESLGAEQPAQQQEPVAYSYTSRITGAQGFSHHPMPRFIDADSWDIKPLYTKDQL